MSVLVIKSSTSLRNDYGMISNLAKETGEPIYITKNGEGDLVVMSIEAFERRDELIQLRQKLDSAERSRVSGETTYSIEESRQRMEKLYDGHEV